MQHSKDALIAAPDPAYVRAIESIYEGRGYPTARNTAHMTALRLRRKLAGSGYTVSACDREHGYRLVDA